MGMKMAKASGADLDMAMELVGMLEALGHRLCPSMPAVIARNDGDEDFDRDDDEQCGRALRALLETAQRGSLFRVVWGAAVMLDASNKLVDPDAATLELHPDHQRNAAALQELARYFRSGNSIPVERATIKTEDFRRITGIEG